MTTPAPKSPTSRKFAVAAALVSLAVLVGVVIFAYRWRSELDVTIGVEGKRIVEIAGPRLSAAPFTPGDALAVRIADVQPISGGFRYDLRYMAFGPGKHDIGQSLRRPDGSPPEPRSEFAVSVAALIPEKYSGELYATPSSEIDLHTSYSLLMGLAWGLWALLLVPLAWYGHQWRRRAAPLPPPPSVAQRLRSLLEQAACESLTAEEQADLEQLLLAFWSQRLNLSEERLCEAVEQLKRHPQAGAQWSRVERWLHRPQSPADGSVAKELLSDLKTLGAAR